MLTYTFSRREKALILAFAIVLVLVAWYWFVFQGTSSAMNRIDGQIAAVNSEIEIAQTRVTQMNNMEQTVEQRKAEGAKKTVMPTYDNLQPLMTELNRIMSAANTFTLKFDELDRESSDFVRRGVRIDYTCATYKKAEAIVNALAGGQFPCSVDTVSINDPTVLTGYASNSKLVQSSAGSVTASVHVTFFEKYPEGYVAPSTDAKKTKS